MTASSTTFARISHAAEDNGRFGVVAIVTAQEFQWVFSARDSHGNGFTFFKEQRRVGVYYFYVLDPDFGAGFIKICTYFPYPAKVWVNGHEWAKRQAAQADDRLRRVGQRVRRVRRARAAAGDLRQLRSGRRAGLLRPMDRRDPDPVHAADRAAGYWWELSVRQVEVSRTLGVRRPAPSPRASSRRS